MSTGSSSRRPRKRKHHETSSCKLKQNQKKHRSIVKPSRLCAPCTKAAKKVSRWNEFECTYYENNYNTSNYVPPQDVLRLKLHSSFPILFLPEYLSRMIASAKTNGSHTHSHIDKEFNLPQDFKSCYQMFLKEWSNHRNKQNVSKIRKAPNGAQKEKSSSLSSSLSSHQQEKKKLNDILVRMIIVPLSTSLISKVARLHLNTNTSTPGSPISSSNKGKEASTMEVEEEIQSTNKVVNCYTRKRTNKRKWNQVDQSLQNLTDGLISTLVRQRKRFTSAHLQSRKNNHTVEYNHHCRGVNILSEGYILASDRTRFVTGTSASAQTKKRKMDKNTNMFASTFTSSNVVQCRNMQPGVQCTQPNSCASYARTSPVMRLLHGLVGDDIIRELLLRCIILIPVDDDCDGDCDGSADAFRKGNYFQLSGPPLTMMSLKIRPEGFQSDAFVKDVEEGSPSDGKDCKNSLDMDPFWIVPKNRMLYADSYTPHVGFPLKHVLNRSKNCEGKANASIEIDLLDSMVKLRKANGLMLTKRWKRIRGRGIDMCRQIIKRHNKCDYHRRLDRACPLPDLKADGENESTLESLIAQCSNRENVVSFFKSVLVAVFPIDFFGSTHNLEIILKCVGNFLTFRKKEQMPLKQIMKGIRISDVPWLFGPSRTKAKRKRPRTDHEIATTLMQNAMRWLYCHFLIPLVRSTFYCTDTEFTGDELSYYRKPVWSKIRNTALKQLKHQFKKVHRTNIASTLKNNSLSCSGLRLLPKPKGIRPIALLCKQERHLFDTLGLKRSSWEISRSTNQALGQVFDVLTYERKLQQHRYGTGMLGLHEIHRRLLDFLQTDRSDNSEFYFVSLDIRRCYDNINQQHLSELLESIINSDSYALQECTVLSPCNNSSKVLHKKVKSIGATGNVINFIEESKKCAKSYNNTVCIDKVRCNVARKTDLLNLLREHLSRNLLAIRDTSGPQLLLQTSGIPQGSILSSMLCNYYYGDMEKWLLDGVFDGSPRSSHLLIRLIDDMLLITDKEKVARAFLQKLTIGSEKFGVQINKAKTRTSHELNLKSESFQSNTVSKSCPLNANGKHLFPYCGLLIDTKSCEVQIDYGRFEETKALNSLVANRVQKEGMSFSVKLRSFVKPRCAPVLFDPRINSGSKILFNFHQTMTMCAIKSYHYIISALDGGISSNEQFIYDNIIRVITFTQSLIQDNLRKTLMKARKDGDTTKYRSLENLDVLFLGTHAFESVFRHTARNEFVKLGTKLMRYRGNLQISSNFSILKNAATRALGSFNLDRFQF